MIGGNTIFLTVGWQKADFDFGDRHHPFYFGIDGIPYVGFGHGNSINGVTKYL